MTTLTHPPLRLPAELTIFTASETRSAWLGWLTEEDQLDSAEPVCVVEADEVTEVDAAGVQLLVSLANTLAGQQRRLQLRAPSAVLRQACLSLGVQGLLLQDVPTGPEAP